MNTYNCVTNDKNFQEFKLLAMVDFTYQKIGLLRLLFILLIITFNALNIQAQSFSQSNLDFNGFGGISNGTSLMFGPDGRL